MSIVAFFDPGLGLGDIRGRRKRLRPVLLVGLFILIVSASPKTLAKDPPDNNRFRVAPYVWAPTLDADLGLGPVSLPISMDAEEMFSYADYGAMGYLQWDFGNHFLFADGALAGMDTDQFEPFFDAPLQADFKVVETGYGQHFELKRNVGPISELLFSPHLSMLHGSLVGEVSGSFSFDIDYQWTGIAVGGTLNARLDNRLTLTLRTVHSGFSGGLKRFFNVLVGVRYPLSDHIALGVGYRFAHAKYSHKDALMDVDLKGSMLGIELNW